MKYLIKSFFNKLIEHYLYSPGLLEKLFSYFLWPLSLIWAFIASKRANVACVYEPKAIVISVGNISVGGSNKSPFARALVEFILSDEFKNNINHPALKNLQMNQIAIILRGYKRSGDDLQLIEASVDAELYGDEACEHKLLLKELMVIVHHNRQEAIEFAIKQGAKVCILDDAFAKFNIKKFDFVLMHEEIKYQAFCIPSGPLRLPIGFLKRADFIAQANKDYQVITKIPDNLNECFFLSTIARANRLDFIRKKCAGYLSLGDHSQIDEDFVLKTMQKLNVKRLICTGKDAVKLKKLNCEIIQMQIKLSPSAKEALIKYFNKEQECLTHQEMNL